MCECTRKINQKTHSSNYMIQLQAAGTYTEVAGYNPKRKCLIIGQTLATGIAWKIGSDANTQGINVTVNAGPVVLRDDIHGSIVHGPIMVTPLAAAVPIYVAEAVYSEDDITDLPKPAIQGTYDYGKSTPYR